MTQQADTPREFKVSLGLLRSVGPGSAGVCLGLESDFESGEMMDYIYRDQAGRPRPVPPV